MMYATKITMRSGCNNSNKCEEIDSIYLTGAKEEQFYAKAVLHDYVKTNPDSIQVNLSPYPSLVPAVSSKGEKYVHSKADGTANDNLLKLPRV